MIIFNGRLQARLSQDDNSLLSRVKQIFGNPLSRIVSLDQMREMLPASDLKNQLGIIRQQILENNESAIGELQISAAVQGVRELAKEIQGKKCSNLLVKCFWS